MIASHFMQTKTDPHVHMKACIRIHAYKTSCQDACATHKYMYACTHTHTHIISHTQTTNMFILTHNHTHLLSDPAFANTLYRHTHKLRYNMFIQSHTLSNTDLFASMLFARTLTRRRYYLWRFSTFMVSQLQYQACI